ncbi:MAG: hypothetical protein H0V89_10300 [Deltaproteobacteria bacterium]|nr:hypothetical protein [Deltaproteobacteria bacterium]
MGTYLDQAATDMDATMVTLTGASVMNTDTGAVVGGDGVARSVPHVAVGTMRVFMFRSLSMSGTLKVSGSRAAVVVSDGAVSITGTVDVSGDPSVPGPGGQTSGSCVGGTTTGFPGGGGGGRYQAGRSGGTGNGTAGGAGGAAISDPDLDPLTAGCRGGHTQKSITIGSPAGGGGGAIQIVSRVSITLSGDGIIDASGGGGMACSYNITTDLCGGGGGGSGGAILLEAPQVVANGAAVVISTKGGSGAAAGNRLATSAAGQDGGTGATAAPGGTNGSLAAGGAGGTATTQPVAGTNSTSANGGGGGGGTGELRVNTLSGSFNPVNGAAIRSYSSVGTLGTRQVP